MSEIALTVIKVLFLALLWLFILSAVSVIRTDLFGRAVPSSDPQAKELESPPPTRGCGGGAPWPQRGRGLGPPPPPPKGRSGPRGTPRVLVAPQGTKTGEAAARAEGVILTGGGADGHIFLDDEYAPPRHARV